MKMMIRLLLILNLTVLILSACSLSLPGSDSLLGDYQGFINLAGRDFPYTLNITTTGTKQYLGNLKNVTDNQEIVMKCQLTSQSLKSMECLTFNIFTAQIFRLQGKISSGSYQGDFEYIEKGVKELEGTFSLWLNNN